MARFGPRSIQRLRECDPDLQRLMLEAVKVLDCSVTCGYRDQATQDALFFHRPRRKTNLRFPDSKHNVIPSRAIDIAPWPIDWDDRERFTLLAGIVLGIAHTMGIKVRWGGDWDRDTEVDDNEFDDLPHFELVD